MSERLTEDYGLVVPGQRWGKLSITYLGTTVRERIAGGLGFLFGVFLAAFCILLAVSGCAGPLREERVEYCPMPTPDRAFLMCATSKDGMAFCCAYLDENKNQKYTCQIVHENRCPTEWEDQL